MACSHDATATVVLSYDRRTARLTPALICECCGHRLATFATIPYRPAPKIDAIEATKLLEPA